MTAPLPETSTNSTTVRSPTVRSVRAAMGAAQRVSPALAARIAERLFVKTQRHEPKERETKVLSSARPFEVRLGRRRIQAWSWDAGPEDGRPVALLVHGWNGRGSQLGSFVEPLLGSGHRVVTFDALGHGQSDGAQSTLPDFADCVAAVAEVSEPSSVLTHSMGGAASMVAMARGRLAPERVVLIAPPVRPHSWVEKFSSFVGLAPDVQRRVVARLERRTGVPFTELEGEPLASTFEIPALVVHDISDTDVPFDSGQRVAKAWRGALLMRTEGLGHRRILGDPEVIETSVAFLEHRSV